MNPHPCRRHCMLNGRCILCGAGEHAFCFQDWHGGCWGEWAFHGWWR